MRINVEVADSAEGWKILAQERLARAQAAEQAHLRLDRELLKAQEQIEILGRDRRDLMNQIARAIQENLELERRLAAEDKEVVDLTALLAAAESARDQARSSVILLADQRSALAEAASEALGIFEDFVRQEPPRRGAIPRAMEMLRRALRGDQPPIAPLGTPQHCNGYDACAEHSTPPRGLT